LSPYRLIYHTVSEDETILLGKKLGEALIAGDFIALAGELGSGKTWFTKGLALGLGISPGTVITSPSFSLVNEYEGRHPLFHIDAYRLEKLSAFLSAGLSEYFDKNGVVVMEWSDRWPEILPDSKLVVRFTIIDQSSRKIVMSGDHPRPIDILKGLEKVIEPDKKAKGK
jgi:tRNA threonylcarbamoyladenosine biosynthesis protein TsaE